MFSTKKIKKRARALLKQYFWKSLLPVTAFFIYCLAVSGLSARIFAGFSHFFGNFSPLSTIFCFFFSSMIFLLYVPIFYGSKKFYFSLTSDQIPDISAIFSPLDKPLFYLKRAFGTWFVCGAKMIAVTLLLATAFLPLHYYVKDFGYGFLPFMILGGFILFLIFVYFILALFPRKYFEQISRKQSVILMKNEKSKLLNLVISFFPWLIFSVLTFGIVLFYFLPYLELSLAIFAEDIKIKMNEG